MTHTISTTLSELLHERTLAEALAHVEQQIRRKPAIGDHLIRLDLLCLREDHVRAAKQIETCAKLDPATVPLMALVRALLHCEAQRDAVFAGTAQPALPEHTPNWMQLQIQALHETLWKNLQKADELREQALSEAPETPGQHNTTAFAWITDSDTRFGPIMEVYAQDRYLWLPFEQIEELEIASPQSIRDLIWVPVMFTVGGIRQHGFLPGRYPGAGKEEDRLALGRETRWENIGNTGVIAHGQKVWTTDTGDVPLYEVGTIRFGASA